MPSIEEKLTRLRHWFAGPKGSIMLRDQQRLIDDSLTHCFGYHLLQLSVDPEAQLYEGCRIQTKFRCHPYAQHLDARCLFEQLPFANESLDTVIVHHAHEFVDDPHLILREMQRIIVPHGHLILVGFNPWSVLGLYSRFARFLPKSIWQNHLLSCGRMKDWLRLLGFDSQFIQFGHHHPQLLDRRDEAPVIRFLKNWPFGDFYIISAQKEVAAMTPIKPQWAVAGNFAGLAQIKPSIRNHYQNSQKTFTPREKEDVA